MSGPFTSPVAQSVPFEPDRDPQYGGNAGPSGILSTNCQDAIEEVKQAALNNDRFILLASYNGNANTGRYLEFFPNIDSNVAPILLTATSKCLSLVIASSAIHTATIGFFNLNVSSTVPVYTASWVAQRRVAFTGSSLSPLFTLPADALLAVRIISNSVNRPHVYFFLNTST